MFALFLATTALAGFTIEAPPFADKAEASALSKDARDTGHKGRVVRRFAEGEGWQYIVRWSFDEAAEAHEAQALLSKAIGAPLSVTNDEGVVVPTPQSSAAVETETEDPANSGPAKPYLDEALEVHGPGVALLADAPSMKVVFERTDADGRVIRHTAVRRGTDQYLKIEPVSGDAVASTTVAAGETAWLVSGGKTSTQDLQRTRETLERFTLPALAPMVLELDRVTKEHEELAALYPKGKVTLDGITCEVAGTRDGGTLFAFDSKGIIRRVSIDGQKRSYDFHDYEAIDDVMIPRTIITRIDGKVRDTVKITVIEMEPEILKAWFTPPG